MSVVWHSAARTHRGNRRPVNEDAVLERPLARLWAVADGLGGHFGGRIASRAVIRALGSMDLPAALADRVDAIDDMLQGMNGLLRRRAHAMGQSGMGTTVVVVTIREGIGAVLWAGDSRLYRLREGALELLTRDHTPLQERLDACADPGAAADDSHLITRAVGCHSALHLDVALFDVQPDDALLLCSDGLYRELGTGELTRAFADAEPERVAERLLDECLGGAARDNVSLVVARPRGQERARRLSGGSR
jgi:serine/threonine protein phosphatase PrpC